MPPKTPGLAQRSGPYAYGKQPRRPNSPLIGKLLAAVNGPRSGLTAKDLRAYAASCAKAQRYTLEQLKAGLAHTTITTTEGYVQQHTTTVSEVTLTLLTCPRIPGPHVT